MVKTQFGIKDLENLSNVKAHTIRIWEKRYNLLEPDRTDTNIRKYDLENLKKLYPGLRDAEMYFTIGGLRSGGTTNGKMVLIGCEIATGNPATDVSEFQTEWLKNVFSKQSLDYILSLNIHELFIHNKRATGKEY